MGIESIREVFTQYGYDRISFGTFGNGIRTRSSRTC